jgi:hypothetical protein
MADPRQQPEWLTAGNTRHLLRSGSRTLSVDMDGNSEALAY